MTGPVRRCSLVALAALAGCLSPPDETRALDASPGSVDASDADASPGSVDASPCPDAFAFSYVDAYLAGTSGGVFNGLALVESLEGELLLSTLVDAGDESPVLELAVVESLSAIVPAGEAFGALDPSAESLIIGVLVEDSTWEGRVEPNLQLQVMPAISPSSTAQLQMTAVIEIGDGPELSRVQLPFTVDYSGEQDAVIVATGVRRVVSTCVE